MGFEVEQADNSQAVKPRLNIAPHSYCWVLVPEGVADHHNDHHNDHQVDHGKIPKKIPKKEQLLVMKWSLQPPYTSEPVKFSTFNTRVESLDPLKPTWRCAKQHRCVVFMQGYYEWHRDTKKPFYIYQDVKKSEGNAKLSASSGIGVVLLYGMALTVGIFMKLQTAPIVETPERGTAIPLMVYVAMVTAMVVTTMVVTPMVVTSIMTTPMMMATPAVAKRVPRSPL